MTDHWFIFAVGLAFFGGWMIRWNEHMRQNRLLLLPILGRRGLSSVQDLEENAGDALHLPTMRATLKWLTEKTGEAEAVFPVGAKEPLYRLTPKGQKTVEAIEKRKKKQTSADRAP